MDLTFSKLFAHSDTSLNPEKGTKSSTNKSPEKGKPQTNQSFSKNAANFPSKSDSSISDPIRTKQNVTQKHLGEKKMLSHRNEIKSEDTKSYPKPVDNTRNMSSNSAEKSGTKATIGPKIRFKGELVGEEDLLVHGKVEGTIDLKGHHLTVGEQGVLQANVSAKTVTIEGKVEGDVFGEERITIRSSSQVQGNIKAERVVLEDGAKFRGSIDMDVSTPSQSTKPSAPSEPQSSKSTPSASGNQPPK